MKKIFALLLIIAMMVCMVTACSKSNSSTDTSTSTSATTDTTTDTAADATTETEKGYFKVGYAAITMDGDFFVTLGNALAQGCVCLLYTSDAADDNEVVDIGGRRLMI